MSQPTTFATFFIKGEALTFYRIAGANKMIPAIVLGFLIAIRKATAPPILSPPTKILQL